MPPARKGNVRVGAPFMHAFRQAFRERDAKAALDLRDEGGERVISGRMASARAAVGVTVLREEIFKDLENLLNTTNMNATQRLDDVAEVERSILNYGIPDVGRRTIDEEGLTEIVEELETALLRYEPRIASRSLDVTRDIEIDKVELKVRFLIAAEIRMDPLNVPMEFLADIVADSGKITLIQT